MQVSHEVLTICPRHRAEFGIRWRCRKIKCTVPEEVAAHKSATSKADRRVDSSISAYILKNTGKLVQVGSRELFFFFYNLIMLTDFGLI